MGKMPSANGDRDRSIEFYRSRYEKFGYSPESLGWDKGKQNIRFSILSGFFDCAGKRILDVGCGFGDINKELMHNYANNYSYLGIDYMHEFIDEGRNLYKEEHIHFEVGNFLDKEFASTFDIVFASGIFNNKFLEIDNYEYIKKVMYKAFELADEGFAFDFLSDNTDYEHAHTFHSNPGKILSFAYELSRNVILQSNYFPFEFAICVMKDDSFSTEDTTFIRWKNLHNIPT